MKEKLGFQLLRSSQLEVDVVTFRFTISNRRRTALSRTWFLAVEVITCASRLRAMQRSVFHGFGGIRRGTEKHEGLTLSARVHRVLSVLGVTGVIVD